MAYYSGTANDMTALRQAIINALTNPSEGWAWDAANEVLSKGTMFLRLQVVSGYLRLLGRTGLTTGSAPYVAQMGPFTGDPVNTLPALGFPVAYELFAFAQEVYCVINYAVDCYQWCAWGKSTVQGLPGTGMWFGATVANANTSYNTGIWMNDSGTSGSAAGFCPGLFYRGGSGGNMGIYAESQVHSDLDGNGWWWGTANSAEGPVGVGPLRPLMTLLPNTWNSEAVLLPMRAYKIRPSNRISLTADLEYARNTRIDNYTPGQVITIGSDRWKIFPWFRKNITTRNGPNSNGNHTGTLGWAIRYEGL